MAAKKKAATKKKPTKKAKAKLEIIVGKPSTLEGTKDKSFPVSLKRGRDRIDMGDYLAKNATEAKRRARLCIRKEI